MMMMMMVYISEVGSLINYKWWGILEQTVYTTLPYILVRWILTVALLALYVLRAYCYTREFNIVSMQ